MTPRLRADLAALPRYVPGKTVAGAVKLASNEVPFPPLEAVRRAIVEAAAGTTRYPDIAATALSERLAAKLGTTPDRIAVGCGSVALCQQLAEITCIDADEIVYPWRSFEAYPIVTQVVRARAVHVPLRDEALDLTAVVAAITDRTRLIFICTPNNPTGTVLHRDEIDAFLAAVPPEVLVVLDEAYREFVDDPDSPDGVGYTATHDNVVVLRTLSKAYGLAGLRVGYAVGSPEVISAMRAVGIPFAVNSLAQAAALAALGCEEEVRDRCAQLTAERVRLQAGLRTHGYAIPPSAANFVWLPLRDRSAEFAAHLAGAGLIVRPFDHPDNGGVRITVGAPEHNDLVVEAAATFVRS